jgi:hypothetical protein
VTVWGVNFAVENFCNMLIFYEVPGTSFSLFCGMQFRAFCCRLCATNDISSKVLHFTNVVTGEKTEQRLLTPFIQLFRHIKQCDKLGAVRDVVGVLKLSVAYNLNKSVSNGSCNNFKTFLNVVY